MTTEPQPLLTSFPPSLLQHLRRLGSTAEALVPLAGDLSPRLYFRWQGDGESAILALYRPEIRDICRRFAETTTLLEELEVRVPRILAMDPQGDWCWQEDLGPKTLYDLRALGTESWNAARDHFVEVVDFAARIDTLPRDRIATLNPPLDADLMALELDQTRRLFVAARYPASETTFQEMVSQLVGALNEGELRPCHRDLMARNLVPLSPGEEARTAVLDHQDLRLGPAYYDLASLLNDSFFPPSDWIDELLDQLRVDKRAFHLAAAQRTLKAVGTYCAFAARGVPRHLPLVAPTLARALDHLEAVPELASRGAQLRDDWQDAWLGASESRSPEARSQTRDAR